MSSDGEDVLGLEFNPKELDSLAEIELEFETAEIEIQKFQWKKLEPIYRRRAEIIKKIPSFWPRALSAFTDLDQAITLPDANIIENAIESIDIERPDKNEIRSFDIIFKFKENEFFTNTELRKSFKYKALAGESFGVISEPLKINWKAGKDITNGATDAAYEYYHKRMAELRERNGAPESDVEEPIWSSFVEEDENAPKHDHDGEHDDCEDGCGGPQPSFFNYFSWWGPAFTYESAVLRGKSENEKKDEKKDEKEGAKKDDEIEFDDDDDLEDADNPVYPGGEEITLAIEKELFPNASRYFTNSLEGDDQSEILDFSELGSDEESEYVKASNDVKKRKAEDSPKANGTKKSKK